MATEANTPHEILMLSPEGMLNKLVTDVYFGNGKPALTLRVAGTEDQIEMLEKTIKDQQDWQKSMGILLVGTLVTSIGGLIAIVVELIKH